MTAIAFSLEFFHGATGQADPGLRRLRVAFERAGAEVANLGKHVFPKLTPALEAAVRANMEGQGTGPAGPFAPLSAKYAAWKAKNFPGAPILQRNRVLLDALTNPASANARRTISNNEMTYGTQGVPYASLHQSGTSRMPARPPIDLGSDFEAEMVRVAKAGIRDAVKEGSEGLLDYEGDTYDDNGTSRAVVRGSRGGAFFINSSGGRTYLNRNGAGQTITRTFGGGRE